MTQRHRCALALHTDCLCVFPFLCVLFAAIKEKYSDWTEFLVQDLTGSRTAPANLLEGVSVGTERASREGEGGIGCVRTRILGIRLFLADRKGKDRM